MALSSTLHDVPLNACFQTLFTNCHGDSPCSKFNLF